VGPQGCTGGHVPVRCSSLCLSCTLL
jgi:hypothetical protein